MKLGICHAVMMLASLPVAAADRGEVEAQFLSARACLLGEGVPKDVKKAFELMKSAADQGYPDAMGGLGYFYSVGVAVKKDDPQAAEWFRKGAEKGSAKAQLNLAKMLLAGNAGASVSGERDPVKLRDEGLQWLKKAADQELPEAALAYGSILYFGDQGVTKDYGKAASYLKVAAEAGNPDARNLLGNQYELGLGVPVDPAAAEQWFRKAALQGQVKAQSNLGRILGPLGETRETRIEALAWLMIASGQGEVTAEKSLNDSMPGLSGVDLDAAKSKAVELQKSIRLKQP